MSRCFPFPLPGYERKARPADVDLLKKEKHKEKKHKKENKDKEKRIDKEKREKDRIDQKHPEKKDKKEKHRDRDKRRNKEKNKAKAKGISNGSDEKKLSGKTKNHSGENVHPKYGKDKNNRVDKELSVPLAGYKTEKINQSCQHDGEITDSKLLQELGRRIKDDAGGTKNLIESFTCPDRRKDEGMVRLVAMGTGCVVKAMEKNKDRRVQIETVDGVEVREKTSSRGNAMVQVGVIHDIEGTIGPLDKNVFREVRGKGKEVDDKSGDKSKERLKDKKSHGKDKEREKEEEAKEKILVKNKEQDKIRENNKNHIIGFHPTKTSQHPKDSNTEGNLKKRKDLEMNGVLHANDFRPGKLPRIAPFSPMKNGRILESCQTSFFHASDKQGAANDYKVGSMECERDGILEASQSSFSPMELKYPKTKTDSFEACTRTSHSDSKYLSQIYSVPKIEECSEFDDQEWLFRSNDSEYKKSDIETVRVETLQVWAEVLQIGSADVCALPYVIPY